MKKLLFFLLLGTCSLAIERSSASVTEPIKQQQDQKNKSTKKKENFFKKTLKSISNEEKNASDTITNSASTQENKSSGENIYSQPNVLKPNEHATTIKNGNISLNDGSVNTESSSNKINNTQKSKANNMSSYDTFLSSPIPSGNKTKNAKTASTNKKAKKYPSYYDVQRDPEAYADYGTYHLVPSEGKLQWENGVKCEQYTQEMYFTDGTFRNKEGKIYKADGTPVNEFGEPIKGARKISSNERKENRSESVDAFLNTPIPSGKKTTSKKVK